MTSGMLGKITKLEGEYVVLEVNNNLTLKFQKASVHAVLPKGTIKAIQYFLTMTLTSSSGKLVIAISSSALFDLTESDAVFKDKGLKAYSKYQIENENNILEKGEAFNLTKKLLEINKNNKEQLVEVILLSRNSADTGLLSLIHI